MIKKLKRNFILVTMLSVLFVLTAIMGIVNGINYYSQESDADVILAILLDNDGKFPAGYENAASPSEKPESGEPPAKPEDGEEPPAKPEDGEEPPAKPGGGEEPPAKPSDGQSAQRTGTKKERRGDLITAETPYERRYFSVELASDGAFISANTGNIAAVTSEDALTITGRLMAEGKTAGYENVYKFVSKETQSGRLYVFLDRTRDLRSVRDLLMISLLVLAGAAVSIFVLVFIFSGVAIKPMAESYEKQKRFITNAGHEIKTPLAVINSCVEVMELETGETKWTRGISSQVERLSLLTKNLVALARMDEGATSLKTEEFSLSEAVREITEPFEIPAEQKGIRFTTDIEENISVKGDPDALSQLCSIMADNAVKYTPEEGEIAFSLKKKGRHVILACVNTAENMEKGSHDELFDRFHRGDSSHNSDKPGFGIGMSMLRSIAEAHGGKAEAYSTDGKSLTVSVRI